MRHEEIEVKFLIEDLVAMRQRLVAIGATLTTPRTYEENLLFDTPDAQLRRQGRLLRLRRDRRSRITYKEPPTHHNVDFKIMQEYEVEVSDFDQTHVILTKLVLPWRCVLKNIVKLLPAKGQRSSSTKCHSGLL
jgi:adenylate cyclase class 2